MVQFSYLPSSYWFFFILPFVMVLITLFSSTNKLNLEYTTILLKKTSFKTTLRNSLPCLTNKIRKPKIQHKNNYFFFLAFFMAASAFRVLILFFLTLMMVKDVRSSGQVIPAKHLPSLLNGMSFSVEYTFIALVKVVQKKKKKKKGIA